MAPCTRESALTDGVIAACDQRKATQGQQLGNCPSCKRIGTCGHVCGRCNDTMQTTVCVVGKEGHDPATDMLNPCIVARLGVEKGEEHDLLADSKPEETQVARHDHEFWSGDLFGVISMSRQRELLKPWHSRCQCRALGKAEWEQLSEEFVAAIVGLASRSVLGNE